ncbi:MAG: RagB/SusD family nutrient uptake outer membrane protein [Chitinophagaceae bacterium]|nr:RagB/SusD family nutrient uptake outer membrane protein [Chitinophagaceae bacterium]
MKFLIIISTVLLLLSCKKQDKWLGVKSSKADVVPSSLKDIQALLDNDGVMNSNTPGIGFIGTDNFYVTYTKWLAALNAQERNAYIWAPDIYNGEFGFDWRYAYQKVEYSNIVLELLQKIPQDSSNYPVWNNVKGSALYFRASALNDLAQIYAKPYNSSTADHDPGLPLRMSSDVNEKSVRATVKETYEHIISDLLSAIDLLPLNPVYQTRPSKVAVWGLLAKVYLNMEDYERAWQYANTALFSYNSLLDFNTVSVRGLFSMPSFSAGNKELIFYSKSLSFSITAFATMVDTSLYQSYDANDLRKSIFYVNRSGGIVFRGSYTGSSPYFSGIATDELYLIRAECFARKNNPIAAMEDLNTLLSMRWRTGTFISLTAIDADDALREILIERRKELPFTGNIRWEDLRRLNKESRFSKTLVRILNGITYTLPPGDLRYTYPIPPDEIALSGLEQNPR